MKKDLPESDDHYSEFTKIANEVTKWELLKAAIELHVFDVLTHPETLQDVASKLSTHVQNTEHFLKALVAVGWLTYRHGYFQNSEQGKRFLTSREDTYLGNYLLFMDGWLKPLQNGGLLDFVREGPKPKENLGDEAIWQHGARVSLNYSRSGRAQHIAEYVAMLPEFPKFTKIMDMGGGTGIIGIAVTAAHPSLCCTVFEQKSVAEVTQEVISEYGVESRVSVVPGNYMTDPIGGDYDFIMANFTLNFYREDLDKIMSKVYAALKPGGIFMVMSDGMNRDKTAPESSVLSWLFVSLRQNSMMFGHDEIPNSMLQAGFVSTQGQVHENSVLAGGHGAVSITLGRKAK